MLKKFSIATLLAALTLAAAASLLGSTPDEPEPVVTGSTIDPLQPVHGLQPLDDIIELWQGRVDTNPLDYLSRTQLGMALATQARETADLDRYSEAELVLRDALDLNPDHDGARLGLSSTLIAQHEFATAADEAERVLAASPRSTPALALVGDANLELGNYPEAGRAYRNLVALERSAPTVSRLARLAYAEGDPALALELATEALDRSEQLTLRPNASAFYWFQVGYYQFIGGQVDDSITSYERALEIDPTNPGASERLAFALAARGRADEAATVYADLLERSPAADLHGLYADVLRSLGRDEEASEQDALGEELAAATIGRYPAERRHLVGFYLTRDPDLAVELAEADAATRQDVGAHDTLAWALHHAGRHEEASAAMEQALQVGTRDAELLAHAGVIAASVGDVEAARTHLAAALRLNPLFHPEDAPRAQALLDELEA